jgi:hypothetical protein
VPEHWWYSASDASTDRRPEGGVVVGCCESARFRDVAGLLRVEFPWISLIDVLRAAPE